MDPELECILRQEVGVIREELAMLNRYFVASPEDFQMRLYYREKSRELLLKMTLLLTHTT